MALAASDILGWETGLGRSKLAPLLRTTRHGNLNPVLIDHKPARGDRRSVQIRIITGRRIGFRYRAGSQVERSWPGGPSRGVAAPRHVRVCAAEPGSRFSPGAHARVPTDHRPLTAIY